MHSVCAGISFLDPVEVGRQNVDLKLETCLTMESKKAVMGRVVRREKTVSRCSAREHWDNNSKVS